MLRTRFKGFKNFPEVLYVCAVGVDIGKKGQITHHHHHHHNPQRGEKKEGVRREGGREDDY